MANDVIKIEDSMGSVRIGDEVVRKHATDYMMYDQDQGWDPYNSHVPFSLEVINITDETDQYDDDEESNTTLIIIICVVVIFILALAAGLTFYFCRKSKKQRDTNTNISLIQRKEETVGETKEDE